MNSRIICVLALAGALAGCASGVSRTGTTMPAAQMAPRTPLQSISLVMTDSGRKDLVDNLTFNQDELLSNVKRALDAKGLLVAGAATPGTSAEIQVKNVRVRSTVTAVLFGFMAGSDSISGDIVIKNSSGQEIDRFKVEASYALGGLAGGQDSSRMNWLYQAFAEQTVKELARA